MFYNSDITRTTTIVCTVMTAVSSAVLLLCGALWLIREVSLHIHKKEDTLDEFYRTTDENGNTVSLHRGYQRNLLLRTTGLSFLVLVLFAGRLFLGDDWYYGLLCGTAATVITILNHIFGELPYLIRMSSLILWGMCIYFFWH